MRFWFNRKQEELFTVQQNSIFSDTITDFEYSVPEGCIEAIDEYGNRHFDIKKIRDSIGKIVKHEDFEKEYFNPTNGGFLVPAIMVTAIARSFVRSMYIFQLKADLCWLASIRCACRGRFEMAAVWKEKENILREEYRKLEESEVTK